MYKLIHKIIGFKTKDLYLGELVIYRYKTKSIGRISDYYFDSFRQPKFALVKVNTNFYGTKYKNIFTNQKYRTLTDYDNVSGHVVVEHLEPIITNKSRITYKDAEKILEEKNTLCIKNNKVKT